MAEFTPVDRDFLDFLVETCGAANVIAGDPEKMEAYSHDEVAEHSCFHLPEAVVKPGSTEEIAAIMTEANRRRIPVTPRGAGSGLSGGAIPVYGGLVLALERMDRILEVDKENLMITLEPGVVTNAVNDLLKPDGLWFAGYPMSLETCFIGGNIAENAGGGKAIKYGVTGRYITGLEVVLPTGEILNLGGKLRKNVTGYDLIGLLTGSEGTLGIITKATLSLMPLPGARAVLLALFPTVREAISAVPRLMTEGKVIPTSIEFMDRSSFATACGYLNESLPIGDARAMLLIEVDGRDESEVIRDYDGLGTVCEDNGASSIFVADHKASMDRVWKIRKNVAEAFKVESAHQSLEDIVVPTGSIPVFMDRLEELKNRHRVPMPCYGHAGDGNLHVTLVKPPAWEDSRWEEEYPKILRELYEITASLGGTLSGEHGIGSKRREYIGINLSDSAISLMKRLKSAFDPEGILNPGKIFP